MVTILEPIVTKFLNEELRPMAERVNGLEALLDDLVQAYDGEVKPILNGYAAPDIIDDGRAAQGVSVLSKNDIVKFMLHATAIRDAIQDADRGELRKPVVRPLSV